MKVLLSWLLDFVETEHSPESLAEALTMSGTEVNTIHKYGFSSEHVVVGEILTSEKHPQADRLSVCTVSVGEKDAPRQIVCGAKNFKVGDKVPVALPGAVLPGGFTIKKSKLRGVTSEGMMCSAEELTLPAGEDGLLILDNSLELGKRVDAFFEQDCLFEIEVTSNRSDLLSHMGLARELVAIGAASWKKRDVLPEVIISLEDEPVKISIEDDAFCEHYTATVFRDVSQKKTPAKIVSRLEAIGLRPINFLVDVTNYLLHHIGQPMHVFDLGKLVGDTIYIRKAKAGEKLLALDHQTYELSENDYVIADRQAPIALAGVIGGEGSAVTDKTRDVLLEVARFSPSAVRKTARNFRLSTDSSYRFERGIDPALPSLARKYAIDLIHKTLGAAPVFAIEKKVPHRDGVLVPLRRNRLASVIGLALSDEEIHKSLSSLGFEINDPIDAEITHWRVPSWRLDVSREADLIEEIARTTPFEKIPSVTLLRPAPASEDDKFYDYQNAVRQILVGMGWHEVLTPPLTNDVITGPKLLNPMTSDHTALRGTLLPQMLDVLGRNLDAGISGLKLFCMEKTFLADGAEQQRLVLVAAGVSHKDNWLEKPRWLDAFDVKAALNAIGLVEVVIQHAGLAQLRSHGLKVPVAYAETQLSTSSVTDHKFSAWGEFPGSRRDVAIVVKKNTPAQEVLSAIKSQAIPLLVSYEIIDVYTDPDGKRIPVDCKTLTLACIYRSSERTLTDSEVDSAHNFVKQALLKIPDSFMRA